MPMPMLRTQGCLSELEGLLSSRVSSPRKKTNEKMSTTSEEFNSVKEENRVLTEAMDVLHRQVDDYEREIRTLKEGTVTCEHGHLQYLVERRNTMPLRRASPFDAQYGSSSLQKVMDAMFLQQVMVEELSQQPLLPRQPCWRPHSFALPFNQLALLSAVDPNAAKSARNVRGHDLGKCSDGKGVDSCCGPETGGSHARNSRIQWREEDTKSAGSLQHLEQAYRAAQSQLAGGQSAIEAVPHTLASMK
eukprot:scaffold40872_cov64-Attheya_sp.AAC.1